MLAQPARSPDPGSGYGMLLSALLSDARTPTAPLPLGVSFHLRTDEASALSVVQALLRRVDVTEFYLGATEQSPKSRWLQRTETRCPHFRRFDTMLVLASGLSGHAAARLERQLISSTRADARCCNVGGGGERIALEALEGFSVYLCLLTRR